MVLAGKEGFWWIGLRAHGGVAGGVDYVWDNGLPLTYTHWDKDQPGTIQTGVRYAGRGGGVLSRKQQRAFVCRQRRWILRRHGSGQDRRLLGRQAVL